ncbi:MAG: DUF2510 domain-containing protein [Microbacteriaceae bacterium]
MSTTLMTEPAAGWYHDPADAGAWRWWDGASWTDHVRPMTEQATATGPVPAHQATATGPVQYQPAAQAPEPAPVSGPVQVDSETIPQPGQVAPAPPVSSGGVPMTPSTPISDQLYWHSAAAEVVEVPRVTQHRPSNVGPRSATRAPSYVRDWNDLGSPHTAGVWLLAFSPIISVAVVLLLDIAMGLAGVTGVIPLGVGGLATLLLTWLFAAMDANSLAQRGYHRPRLAWMLLFPPLAYLIARGKEVRRESKRAWPPELVFILNFVGLGALTVVGWILYAAVILTMLPGAN